jgi:lipopolysaccharide/colanic/teichoic acid biosynthesis glycosyltransferase
VTVVPFLGEMMGASAEVEAVGGVTVLGLPRFDLPRSTRAAKRALDLVGAGIGLVLVAPLMVLIGALVKLDSRGPVLFRQLRAGRDGKAFWILKFRTMVDGADEQKSQLRSRSEADGLFKIADDPRITRVGRFLRRTSLDELPQLWNVVRGDMSLVGPRPLVLDEDAKVVGWFRHRLQLQPGITGHWQVLGSARIPLDDMIRIDYLYVANWSLWGDIKLLLQTVPYVLGRRGL